MSDTIIRKPSKFAGWRKERVSADGAEEKERRFSYPEEATEPENHKGFQIKGAHEKSYLDLSQMRLTSHMMSTTSDLNASSPSGLAYDVSKMFDQDFGRDMSESILSESAKQSNQDMRSKLKKMPSFLGCNVGKSIFHGEYDIRPMKSAELLVQKPNNFSELSFFQTKREEDSQSKISTVGIRCKSILKSEKRNTSDNRRGYYSEVLSPFIRPERILEERQREEEKMMKEYLEEFEGEYEGEIPLMEMRGEDGWKIEKGPWKEWPPIFKVLNPESALAEMALPIAYKEPSLINKGTMPKFAPHLENVPQTDIRDFLHPEEKWVVYETEPNIAFPVQAFRPRCYILHVVEPGKLPRKVFVERRRRQYLSMSVEELLEKHGLTDDDLLPPTTSEIEDQFSLFGTKSFLPLEVFDDDGFDPCSVNDWLALGKIENVQHPIPAVAFIPIPTNKLMKMKIGKASLRYTNKERRSKTLYGMEKKAKNVDIPLQYVWLDVAVVGYNQDTSKWNIVTLDGSQTKISLPRIYVMFMAEDPQNFALRVLDAVHRRHQAEKLIKFHIYCDSMPVQGLPDLEKDTMDRIHKSVTRNGVIKGVEDILNVVRNFFFDKFNKYDQLRTSGFIFKRVISEFSE